MDIRVWIYINIKIDVMLSRGESMEECGKSKGLGFPTECNERGRSISEPRSSEQAGHDTMRKEGFSPTGKHGARARLWWRYYPPSSLISSSFLYIY